MPLKRGLFGGTFDPVHVGHLLAAEEAREALGLDEVMFIPAGEPWMRQGEHLASWQDRWAMVTLAVQTNPRFTASRMELERPGPTYAVDTLMAFRASDDAAEFTFILGLDALLGLPRWKDPQKVLTMCRIAAVARPGHDAAAVLASLKAQVPEAAGRIDLVPSLDIDVSATDIRRRVREGRSIRYRVPEAVESYIMERRLYR